MDKVIKKYLLSENITLKKKRECRRYLFRYLRFAMSDLSIKTRKFESYNFICIFKIQIYTLYSVFLINRLLFYYKQWQTFFYCFEIITSTKKKYSKGTISLSLANLLGLRKLEQIFLSGASINSNFCIVFFYCNHIFNPFVNLIKIIQ